MQGGIRYILYLAEASPADLKAIPPLKNVISKVRNYRLGGIPAKGKTPDTIKEPGISSLKLAETPRKFHVTVVPKTSFLVVPKVSSERRHYVPIGFLEPPTIASDLVFVLPSSDKATFAMLTSAMHMGWMRHFAGRLKSDYRYAIGLVYNTFPMPPKPLNKLKLEPLVDAVLQARADHPDASLADLYDPDYMPEALRKSHATLDRAVDKLYRAKAFASERERVEHLFGLYEQMTAPIEAAANSKPRRRKKK